MAQFCGQPNIINRMLGLFDGDDATNLPIGLASVCRDMEFFLTSVRTRAGINTAIQGVNKSPITGLVSLIYQAESASESSFQLPLLFDMKGALQGEFNVGSGTASLIESSLVTLPQNAHMIGAQAYNMAWLAFSNLITPSSAMASYNLKTNTLDPYGMKPFGWLWLPNTQVLAGEVCCPNTPNGNGHTYQCTQAGTTGANQPTWPLTENGTIADGTAIWMELTPVLANAIPSPPVEQVGISTSGSPVFPAGYGVQIAVSLVNGIGETVPTWQGGYWPQPGFSTAVSPITVNMWGPSRWPKWMQNLPAPYRPMAMNVYVALLPLPQGENPVPRLTNYTLFASVPITSANVVVNGVGADVLATPVNSAFTTATTGGSLPGSLTYYYRVAALNSRGVTLASTETSIVVPNTTNTNTVTVNWGAVSGAAGYQIYGRTSGSEELVATINSGATTTWLDNGSAIPNGLLPTANTTGQPLLISTARITPGQLPAPVIGPTIQAVTGGTVLGSGSAQQAGYEGPFSGAAGGNNGPYYSGSSQQAIVQGVVGGFLGRDVYVCQTYLNAAGETTPGPASLISNASGPIVPNVSISASGTTATVTTAVGHGLCVGSKAVITGATPGYNGPITVASVPSTPVDTNGSPTTYTFACALPAGSAAAPGTSTGAALIQVTVPAVGNYAFTGVNIYEADVPTGTGQPAFSQFGLVGTYQPGAVFTIATSAAGYPPPIVNGTGPGGSVAPDTPTGGINGTQGYRYAGIQFINRNSTVSGFTPQSVVSCIIDQGGWQVSAFNVPTGPSYIQARQVSFTEADGTQDGPFFVNGTWDPGQLDNLVYPGTALSDGVNESSTIFGDNVTTTGTFNFDDSYLIANGDVTDRLRVIWPYPAVDVYYSEIANRIVCTGVPGFNGHWFSLPSDPESYYGDTGFLAAYNTRYGKAICARDYRGSIYSFLERAGYAIETTTGEPSTWPEPVRRWTDKGPCGPRAVDVCDDFIIFVHESGIYRYVDTEAEFVSKEIPHLWANINWAAKQTIVVKIDTANRTVRIGVPLGASTVPNAEITISYLEGWNNPIHFSTYTSREISMDSARRYAVNSKQFYVMERLQRTITNVPQFTEGPSSIEQLGRDWYTSQFCYGSSGADGTVQAITPGIFSDNGRYIPWRYETVSPVQGMALTKAEGFTLNAKGFGSLLVTALSGRKMTSDWSPPGSPDQAKVLHCAPIDLSPDQDIGISRMFPSRLSERWRLGFESSPAPGSWAELKFCILYTVAMAGARARSEG